MESQTAAPDRRSGRTPGTNPVIQWVCVGVLLVLAWGAFAVFVGPRPVPLGNGTLFTAGLAVTAFLLGVRHAFDADHIAAIDNATRRLQTLGHPGHAVGFWFALGHSTIVLAAVLALSAGLSVLARQLGRDDSAFATATGLWGATFSGLFLVVIGIVNAVALWRVLRADETDAAPRGPMSLLFGRAIGLVTRPSRMFGVGLLFGLGFDTATTIGLFVVAGGAVAVSWWVALVLPLLFTAGMVLCDSLNGTLMRSAYRWAGDAPRRRRTYNAVMLGLSVVVALTVGTVALAGALSDGLGIGGVVAWWGALDIADGGIVILAVFLTLWLVMTLADRRRRPA